MTDVRVVVTVDEREAKRRIQQIEAELQGAKKEANDLDRTLAGAARRGAASRASGGSGSISGGGGGGGLGSLVAGGAAAAIATAVAADLAVKMADVIAQQIGGVIGEQIAKIAAGTSELLAQKGATLAGISGASQVAGAFGAAGLPLSPAQLKSVFDEAKAQSERNLVTERRQQAKVINAGVNYVKEYLGGGGGGS